MDIETRLKKYNPHLKTRVKNRVIWISQIV